MTVPSESRPPSAPERTGNERRWWLRGLVWCLLALAALAFVVHQYL